MKGCLTEDFQGSETGVYGMVVDVCHQTPVKGTELEQKARAIMYTVCFAREQMAHPLGVCTVVEMCVYKGQGQMGAPCFLLKFPMGSQSAAKTANLKGMIFIIIINCIY